MTRITLKKAINHLKTISKHKYLVMKGCFAIGLYYQGIMHDLSKFSPTEFLVGARYWQGFRSPNNAEREEIGYSTSWLHHKGRNRHHFEYWIDYTIKSANPSGMEPAPMPEKYVLEMVMDRIAASKTYNGASYTDSDPINYYNRGLAKMKNLLHPDTKELLEYLLTMLSNEGEEKTFRYIRNNIGNLLAGKHENR